MKKNVSLSLIIILFSTLVCYPSRSKITESNDNEETRTENFLFKCADDVKFAVDNSFGNIHIDVWDKKETSIKVEIIVSAKSKSFDLQEILDEIDVNVAYSHSNISLKTDIDTRITNKTWRRESLTYKVNCTIFLPRNAHMDLTSSHGNITIVECNNNLNTNIQMGDTEIGKLNGTYKGNHRFGDLNINGLNNVNTAITLKHGSVKLEGDNTSNATIRSTFGSIYIGCRIDNITINNAHGNVYLSKNVKNLNLTSSFSKTKLELVENITLSTKHDKVYIVETNNLNVKSSEFTSFHIDKLNTSFVCDRPIKFSDITVLAVDMNVKNIDINSNRGNIGLIFNGIKDYELALSTSHGKLKVDKLFYNSNNSILVTSLTESLAKSGKDGKIKLTNQFADINIGVKQ